MYEIRVHCSNCNEETRIKIPDGKEIASQRCPTCRLQDTGAWVDGEGDKTMSFKTTDRGFKHYEPIKTDYGHEVRVYESSAAMRPCIWLSVELTEEIARAARTNIEPCKATAHMTIEQAERIRDAIDAAIKNHYQFSEPADASAEK